MLLTILLIIVFSSIFLIIELLVQRKVFSIRKDFPWLITEKDETPILSKTGLTKFISHGYDPELGWIRKPFTMHDENGKYSKTEWHINKIGARSNPLFDGLESTISCYGDSFAFSRQVNDDETWSHHLSEITNTNVLNFSVGNYGVDQSLLRLKREYAKNKTKIVILAVVPETISRIQSMWKHYSEYGNTFGFKPRFVIVDDKLTLLKNPIDSSSKFELFTEYLDHIQQNDFFYKNKFLKEKLHFPYSITILKNLRRNFGIISSIDKINKLKKQNKDFSHIAWNPMRIIMQNNKQWRIRLFQDSGSCKLLKMIIQNYVDYSKQQNFHPIFIFLPQKDDLIFIKNNSHFFENFSNELKSMDGLTLIDVTNDLLRKKDLGILYSDNNDYGGHFSKEGNKLISELIARQLKNLNLI